LQIAGFLLFKASKAELIFNNYHKWGIASFVGHPMEGGPKENPLQFCKLLVFLLFKAYKSWAFDALKSKNPIAIAIGFSLAERGGYEPHLYPIECHTFTKSISLLGNVLV